MLETVTSPDAPRNPSVKSAVFAFFFMGIQQSRLVHGVSPGIPETIVCPRSQSPSRNTKPRGRQRSTISDPESMFSSFTSARSLTPVASGGTSRVCMIVSPRFERSFAVMTTAFAPLNPDFSMKRIVFLKSWGERIQDAASP